MKDQRRSNAGDDAYDDVDDDDALENELAPRSRFVARVVVAPKPSINLLVLAFGLLLLLLLLVSLQRPLLI